AAASGFDLLRHALGDAPIAQRRVHEAVHQALHLAISALQHIAHGREERQSATALGDPVTGELAALPPPDLFRVPSEEELVERPTELGYVGVLHRDDGLLGETLLRLRHHEIADRTGAGDRADAGQHVPGPQRIVDVLAVEVDPADPVHEQELV